MLKENHFSKSKVLVAWLSQIDYIPTLSAPSVWQIFRVRQETMWKEAFD